MSKESHKNDAIFKILTFNKLMFYTRNTMSCNHAVHKCLVVIKITHLLSAYCMLCIAQSTFRNLCHLIFQQPYEVYSLIVDSMTKKWGPETFISFPEVKGNREAVFGCLLSNPVSVILRLCVLPQLEPGT